MSNIRNFISSAFIYHLLNLSWEIIISKILKAIIKKGFFISIWIESLMSSWVLVSSAVSEPNIISMIRKYKGGSFISEVIDPSIRRREKSMLKKHCRSFTLLHICHLIISNSMHVQNVPILSCNLILVANKVLFSHDLAKAFIFILMRCH